MKHILSILILAMCCAGLSAKPKKCTVYMFGFGASFTDSVAYITEVQPVTPAYIETSTRFLYDRSLYALQLRNFMEEKYQLMNPTCVVFFSTKKGKMASKREKLRKRYLDAEGFTLMRLPAELFTFVPEDFESHELTDPFEEHK